MQDRHIGDVRVTRVEEQMGPGFPAKDFLSRVRGGGRGRQTPSLNRLIECAVPLGLCLLAACAESPPRAWSSSDWHAGERYTGHRVFFDSGSTVLSDEARRTLAEVASMPREQWLRVPSSFRYCVVGNADNTGTEMTNKNISRRRAEVVAEYLVELGMPREGIVVKAKGNSAMLVKTPPNTAESQNRSVEIFRSVQGCDHIKG